MSELAVKLTNVSKKYDVFHQKRSLVSNLIGRQQRHEEFLALKNINLTVNKGDRIGIIGPNGSGKTTLMKIIAGITQPTAGKVEVNGRTVALIDLEAGFHPDLTGIENLIINGLLVGMTLSEVNAKKEQIVRFADIGNFIDAPFHTYSAGMKFRLAFAVAVASECEILIMDEVFMAGDVFFQEKSVSKLVSIQKERKITTIICSHEPLFIWKFSKRLLELDHGVLTIKPESYFKSQQESLNKKWRSIFETI